MKSSSGGVTSFKKKGRLDAAFVRAETNNVDIVLMVARREYITIAVTNLSDLDRDYVDRAVRLDHPNASSPDLPAIERNELSRRKVEAAKVREDAAAKRQQAQSELEDAAKLDNEAAILSDRANDYQSQAQAASDGTNALPASDNAKRAVAIASSAADQLQQDIAKLRFQTQEKRQKATDLQKEAAQLEHMADLLETNTATTTPGPASTGAKNSNPDPEARKENPNS